MTAPKAGSNVINEFLERYSYNWPLLVREVLGVEPDAMQDQILTDVQNGERRISVRSGHRVGKTTVTAWCIICQLLTRFPQKTVATAPTSGQLFDVLYAETVAWMSKMPAELQKWFEIKSDQILLVSAPKMSFVSFKTSRPETPEALAGVHSPGWVLLIGEEASGIAQQVFESASGSMAGHRATTLLVGNPVRTEGLFYDTHNRVSHLWKTYHISCVGHPRVSPDFIEDMRVRYGEESNAYRVRVLGEFPRAGDDAIFPLELVEAALLRDVRPLSRRAVWGVDVARFGTDKSGLCKRQANVLVQPIIEWGGYDTMQTVGRVKMEWDSTPEDMRPEVICVDAIGLGAGVADRLRELGLPARAINVSESPGSKEKYRNLRAELAFEGREWFAQRDCNIAGDKALKDELIGIRYKTTSSGKLQAESKEDMKKRGFASPNRADAFLLTFAVKATVMIGAGKKADKDKPLKRPIKGIV